MSKLSACTPSVTSERSARRSLQLVLFESALTHGSISVAIMTPFWRSIGMSQAEIAASQAIFTIVVCLLNFPTGWLADRLGRKWANVVGDFGCLISYLCYSRINGFVGAVVCECLLGIFMSFSQGVDFSLLRHFSVQIDPSGKIFRQKSATLAFWQYIVQMSCCLLGGPIGAISFRLAIFANAVTYGLGGIVSIFIADNSERRRPELKNPLRDMWRIAHRCLAKAPLRRRILAYAIAREITHGIIWVFTPMLMLVGVPLTIVSGAWALNALMCTIGTKLAARFSGRLRDWQIVAAPLILVGIGLGIISVCLSIWTIWFYLLVGLAQGWTGAALMPLVQNHAPASEQTSIVSLTKVFGQMLYIPAVYLIGIAADIELRYAATMTLIIFLPLGFLVIRAMQKREHK